MKTARQATRDRFVLLLVLAALSIGAPPVWASAAETARWLPEDTLFFVSTRDVKALVEKWKTTSTYALYKDPAMQPFMVPAEKNVRAKINEGLKELIKEIGLDRPPEKLPWPEGRIVIAGFLQSRTIMVPDYSKLRDGTFDRRNFKPEDLPKIQQTTGDFQAVFLVDMGKNLGLLRDLAERAASQAVQKGMVRQRETVRGTEINILKESADADENFDTLCYGFCDSWLVAGSSLKYIREVLMRRSDPDMPSLARSNAFTAALRLVGDGDVVLHLNAKPILATALASVPAAERNRTEQIIKALAVDSFTGVSASVTMVPKAQVAAVTKMLLGIRGQRRGIPALLAPSTSVMPDHRLLSRGLADFLVANYDLPTIYEGIGQLVQTIGNMDMNMMVQAMLAMATAQGGDAPVNLKQDIIGQLTTPIMVTSRIGKPYDDPAQSSMLLALGVRDGATIDNALGRIHQAFIARGNKELQRELLNRTIYLLPELPVAALFGGAGSGAGIQLAFAVAGDHLVFGTVASVEQSIRDLRREDLEPIRADAMFQHARRHVPAQAGIYFYQNQQIAIEKEWFQLKEAARKAATGDSAKPSGNPSMEALAALGTSPWTAIVRALEGIVDFSPLPEFSAVKKYFGASVGSVTANDQGIYAEFTEVESPSFRP